MAETNIPSPLSAAHQALFESLKRKEMTATVHCGDLTIRIERQYLGALMELLKDEPEFDFQMLIDVTAIDWMDSELHQERFEVVYQLLSLSKLHRLTVRTYVPESDPKVPSMLSLWKGANFMERECFDMYGITFEGHPDLRRLLMYDEFRGHPLRKDYPVQLKQPRIQLRTAEVDNSARLMVRPDLVKIRGAAATRERPTGGNPILGGRA